MTKLVILYLLAMALVLYFNYACSVASNNHNDPHRDEGQN